MTFTIVWSVILGICAVLLLGFPGVLKVMPVGMRALPLVAMGILWLNQWLFAAKNTTNFFSVVVMIAFWFFTVVMVMPISLGVAVMNVLDAEQERPEVVKGDASKPAVLVVYHPGGSDFTARVADMAADNIVSKGFRAVIRTANKKLPADVSAYTAIVALSPVYAGMARPPLTGWLNRAELGSKKITVITCGGGLEIGKEEAEMFEKTFEGKKLSWNGKLKVSQAAPAADTKARVDEFLKGIAF